MTGLGAAIIAKGTTVCDLERRGTIALLPDREPAAAAAWLTLQPQIAIVARNRGGGYGQANSQSLPCADQLADRWYLLENASHAFLEAVRKSMRQVRRAIGAATVNPKLLTAAERLQLEGYLCREETNKAILALAAHGVPLKGIVRQTGHSRKLVRYILRRQRTDVFRVRKLSLEVHLPWLEAGGKRACATRPISGGGCGRQDLQATCVLSANGRRGAGAPRKRSLVLDLPLLPARIALERDGLSKAQSVRVAAFEQRLPDLVEARDLDARFHEMLRRK